MSTVTTVNGVDVLRLHSTVEAITADPALAAFQFRARTRWVDGGHSRTEIQGFYGAGQEDTTRERPFVLDTDEPPVLLGENRGPERRRVRPAGPRRVHRRHDRLPRRRPRHGARRAGDHSPRRPGRAGLPRPGPHRPPGVRAGPGLRQGGRRPRRRPTRRVASLARFSPVRDMVINPVPVAIEVARA